MFRKAKYTETQLTGVELEEGECLNDKLSKLKEQGGQIETGSPSIYTERKDGVLPETNIRTDRFEIAQNAMQRSVEANRNAKARKEAEEAAKTTEMGTSTEPNVKVPENAGNGAENG